MGLLLGNIENLEETGETRGEDGGERMTWKMDAQSVRARTIMVI